MTPDKLTEQYKEQLNIVKKLFPYFKHDNSKYNIIIFKAYLTLGEDSFEAIVQLLEQNENLLQEFEFKRNNLIKFIGLICKNNKKALNESNLAYIMLQFFDEKIQVYENFDFDLHKNIFYSLFILNNIHIFGIMFFSQYIASF